MDFTLKIYLTFLKSLSLQNYSFQSFQDFLARPQPKTIILRHDVDLRPEYSLRIAQIEHSLGIAGTYFFRLVPESYNEKIIHQIASLGHEIGYHYEDLTLAKGDIVKGIELFANNLQILRTNYGVTTACMHGSPLSPWDSRDLWKEHDYRDFGIEAEPYFDFNMEKMIYLTDTGRRWNGLAVSVRDKALGSRLSLKRDNKYTKWKVKPIQGSLMNMTENAIEFQKRYSFKSTNDMIISIEEGNLSDNIMLTTHPQRWTDQAIPWMKEFIWQNVKNVGKYFLIKAKSDY